MSWLMGRDMDLEEEAAVERAAVMAAGEEVEVAKAVDLNRRDINTLDPVLVQLLVTTPLRR